jgi:hypothetical protein
MHPPKAAAPAEDGQLRLPGTGDPNVGRGFGTLLQGSNGHAVVPSEVSPEAWVV